MMNTVLEFFPIFLLIFARVSAFFVTMPILSYRTIPATHKIGVSLYLSVLMTMNAELIVVPFDLIFVFLIIKEVVIGVVIGLFVQIVLSAVHIAGGFLDFQMGFSMANVMDPHTGSQTPIMGQYLNYFTWLLLITMNGHHLLLDGIYYSIQTIPLTEFTTAFAQEGFVELVLKVFSAMFVIAMQMAIPVVGSILLIDVAVGILSKAVPQLNLFAVAYPIKIFAGLVVLILTIPAFFIIVEEMFELAINGMRAMINLLGGM